MQSQMHQKRDRRVSAHAVLPEADQQRFLMMAEEYDRMAPYLVPMYGWLQKEMLRQSGVETLTAGYLVDLGAGSGIFLEKALMSNPGLRGVWVDSSPAFMAVAQRRLAPMSERMTYILSPLEEPWEDKSTEPVQAITSMSAIHHLQSSEKRALYERCYSVLAPGGWFLNCDEMTTISREAYMNSLYTWVRHVDNAGQYLAPEQIEEYERWQGHFARWKARNIDCCDEPKRKGDDLHEPFLTQLSWLREIGFTGADLFAKYHLWCVVGGQK